jgi:hypothetical protein
MPTLIPAGAKLPAEKEQPETHKREPPAMSTNGKEKVQVFDSTWISRSRLESLLRVLHGDNYKCHRRLDVWVVEAPERLDARQIEGLRL